MQTTPNLGMVIPSSDNDPFDEMAFVNALLKVDAAALLAYAEFASEVDIHLGTAAAQIDIVTAPAVVLDGTTSIIVQFFSPYSNCAAGQIFWVHAWDGATDLGRLAVVYGAQGGSSNPGAHGWRRYTPTAGSHTYKIRGFANSNGLTGGVGAYVGGAGQMVPGFIRVMRG